MFCQYSVAMASLAAFKQFLTHRDWRIWFGIIFTVGWMAGGILFVIYIDDSQSRQAFSLESVGSFLEGVFAPLAFLWLVIGLFIQQRELANNSDALRKTSEQSEKQTQAIAATEMNARQETFFKIAEAVKHQLGGISGMLLVSGLGPVGNGSISRDQMNDYFSQAANGDNEVFARMFISQNLDEVGGLQGLLFGTELRQRHAENYMRTFERLCRLAANCDVDSIIEDSLRQSAFGLLYSRMEEHQPDVEPSEQEITSENP